ncbi:SEN2 [[Candida] subhashii]|uniref:tRNA-splicing endonuclease subunit Sen2 n=1 Tax=[Candida] subhashii TaxID=561895 RepID=A0A8J5QPY4_9ASCO|nr:SEN2 [[Candida] subhashii]KAG7664440.1 SEN2 [[Candida] subhashii]
MGKRNNKQLNKIYSKPLPITLTSDYYNGVKLPNLYPHNPISWIWYIFKYIQINSLYTIPESKILPVNVHYDEGIFKVIDEEGMKKLWQQGFFGKGILSRSEPTWKERTITRLQLDVDTSLAGDLAMEDVTKLRREERKLFKLQRAKVQELELKTRQGIITQDEVQELEQLRNDVSNMRKNTRLDVSKEIDSPDMREEDEDIIDDNGEVIQLEFLQLQNVETFFLKFALNVIEISTIDSIRDLFKQCCLHYDNNTSIAPNNKFILDYVVYHHFRSLGWCVRSGVKFGTDFLLYKRGPPFIHAEYCILVIPNDESIEYDWFQMAAKARVIGTVKKIFVLVYVDCPKQTDFDRIFNGNYDDGLMFKELFRSYRVSEILYRRWAPSRTRD